MDDSITKIIKYMEQRIIQIDKTRLELRNNYPSLFPESKLGIQNSAGDKSSPVH